MSRRLPPHSSLTHLKHQAKDLLKVYQTGDSSARDRVRASLPRLSQSSAADDPSVTLQEVQHVIAREYGFQNWSRLAAYHRRVIRTERFERRVPFGSSGAVSVSAISGQITVATWDRLEVEVQAVKRVQAGPEDEAERQLRALEMVLRESPDRLDIEAKQPEVAGWKDMRVDFSVTVPVAAEARLSSVNAGLAAKGSWRKLVAETINGDVSFIGTMGSASLDTFNGRVVADIGGADGEVKIQTFNGDIEVHLPAALAVDLQAETKREGRITNSLGITGLRENGSSIKGRLGGGGPLLSLKTTNGHIRLLPAPATGR